MGPIKDDLRIKCVLERVILKFNNLIMYYGDKNGFSQNIGNSAFL